MPARSKFKIEPPLLNSASPWATTISEIKSLYDSPYTGAVTTRTSLLEGFTHDPKIHQHIYFQAGGSLAPSSSSSPSTPTTAIPGLQPESITIESVETTNNIAQDPATIPAALKTHGLSSLNTYGYSPYTLSEYLGYINEIVGQRHLGTSITSTKKPFILSVTGTPDEIAMAYALIANAAEMDEDLRLAMEVNLSCPNIEGKPPPAYERVQLLEYLEAIRDGMSTYRGRMASEECVPRVGVKLPPYTYRGQFEMVVECLREVQSGEPGEGSVVDFITCTNTLGSSLVLTADDDDIEGGGGGGKPALGSESGLGLGGLAGAALHPLALGNVKMFRGLLDAQEETRGVMVIGVGGVEDAAGFGRMRKAGAGAVGCATALGRYGVGVFGMITKR